VIQWPDISRPGFVVFFQDYRPAGYGSGMPEDQSYHDFGEIEALMRGILDHPGNFLGLIDQFDETLQFYVNDDKSVLVDFIVKGKGGSLQKVVSLSECIALTLSTSPSLADLSISGAEFKTW
jgi:hypothetical protein